MAETLRTVAILAAQPALNALLGMVLSGAPNLRVRTFESELTLQVYMRIARVDLVVVDCDDIEVEAISLLRADDAMLLDTSAMDRDAAIAAAIAFVTERTKARG